jgi:hypothetical protein
MATSAVTGAAAGARPHAVAENAHNAAPIAEARRRRSVRPIDGHCSEKEQMSGALAWTVVQSSAMANGEL